VDYDVGSTVGSIAYEYPIYDVEEALLIGHTVGNCNPIYGGTDTYCFYGFVFTEEDTITWQGVGDTATGVIDKFAITGGTGKYKGIKGEVLLENLPSSLAYIQIFVHGTYGSQ